MDWKEYCKGCGDCCGPIPFTYGFYLAHKSLITVEYILEKWENNMVVPVTRDTTCAFYDKETSLCKIYDERPQVCRDYGNIEELKCPRKKVEI